MNPDHIVFLRCPKTFNELKITSETLVDGRIKEGSLVEPISGNTYPIVNFIPRFVPIENYAAGFGYQWNVHDKTQYDEKSEINNSRERFYNETKWGHNLEGQVILEIGSGSGRFTKEVLETGATVVSFDYSTAVEANYKSNGRKNKLLIVQASIYEMPFPKNFFDKAFCFGVLQHTPDPEAAFLNIPQYLKPNGKMATDIYIKNLGRWVLQPKYWVRPFTKRKNPEKLYGLIKKYIDFMWPLARVIRKIPKLGPTINWKLLVADYSNELPNAKDHVLKEWAYLNTMDMLSPMYDKPATVKTFKHWHEKAGLADVDVHIGYNGIEGRATKK